MVNAVVPISFVEYVEKKFATSFQCFVYWVKKKLYICSSISSLNIGNLWNSSHQHILKQWADTKECQSLLPELMRRLICASVKQLNRLSFPSGDAVHMPEWAGADTWVLI